jgi:Uma2 family endonuclease
MLDTHVLTQTTHPELPVGDVTFEEFMAWSLRQEFGKSEWIDGNVYIYDMGTTAKHSRIIEFLMGLMRLYLEVKSMSGDILGPEFTMRLNHRRASFEPDILFVSGSKLGNVTSTYLQGGADLVVEVVSLESIDRDYQTKFAAYQTEGISEYWIIDPLEDTCAFYRLDANKQYQAISLDAEGKFVSTSLLGFTVDSGWFIQDPLPQRLPIIASW